MESERGKKFICWLTDKYYRDTKLFQGDTVLFRIKKRWWKGIIRRHGTCYYVHIGRRKFWAFLITDLRVYKQ